MAFSDPADIELLILDVDGVMTAGQAITDQTGNVSYVFDVSDGSGIKYWHRCGGKTAIITGRSSNAVTLRAEMLDITMVYQSALRKIEALRTCLADSGVCPQRICCMGDDLPDLPVMLNCGYPVAVANAAAEVAQAAAYVTTRPGGSGAVREVVELILRAKGKWDQIVQNYHDQKL